MSIELIVSPIEKEGSLLSQDAIIPRALDFEPEQMYYQVDKTKGYVLVLGMVFSQEKEIDLQPTRGQGQI